MDIASADGEQPAPQEPVRDKGAGSTRFTTIVPSWRYCLCRPRGGRFAHDVMATRDEIVQERAG